MLRLCELQTCKNYCGRRRCCINVWSLDFTIVCGIILRVNQFLMLGVSKLLTVLSSGYHTINKPAVLLPNSLFAAQMLTHFLWTQRELKIMFYFSADCNNKLNLVLAKIQERFIRIYLPEVFLMNQKESKLLRYEFYLYPNTLEHGFS